MSKADAWSTSDAGEMPARVLAELEAAKIEPGRPLVAVDADEVLIHFAAHFKTYCEERGYGFALIEYRLDSALSKPDGARLSRDEISGLIWGFIEERTRRQPPIDGAAAALRSLSAEAQVVVLTNAPSKVRADRIANLAGHGMSYPVVMNEGGKGRALAWLSARARAPVVFVDDSVAQHGSAAKHAPQVMRFHMVAPEILRPIIGEAPGAIRTPSWLDALPRIERALAGGL